MIKLVFSYLLLLTITVLSAQDNGTGILYVGTFTSEGAEGIYQCSFNSMTGSISQTMIYKGVDNPNFLRKSPDGKYLYLVSRSPRSVDPSGGSVAAYRIGFGGNLEFINKQSSQGNDPCYVDISPDGKWVAIANYGGGSVAVYPVDMDGSLKSASGFVKHRGSGPHSTRQKQPHAHSIRFSKDGKTLYAADLGTDQLLIYQLEEATGMISPSLQPYVALPPGSGPRHFEFSSDEKFCYMANELNSTVSVLERKNGRWTVTETLSTLPSGYTGDSFCADIHLSPDGKFVYVSNRGHQSIAVFGRNEYGSLSAITNVNVQGDWPRNFIIDPSGKYMLVANQRSHNIAVFELRSGVPVYIGNQIKIPAPVSLAF